MTSVVLTLRERQRGSPPIFSDASRASTRSDSVDEGLLGGAAVVHAASAKVSVTASGARPALHHLTGRLPLDARIGRLLSPDTLGAAFDVTELRLDRHHALLAVREHPQDCASRGRHRRRRGAVSYTH